MSSNESERYKLSIGWILRLIRNQTVLPDKNAVEVYSKLLCHVASADGVLAPAEREWIIGNRAAIGASEEVIEMLKSYEPSKDDWRALLRTKRSFIEVAKYMLLYDAFQAAAADNELHEKEREAISKLGAELEIDESTIEKLAQLHKDEAEIKKRRLALVFPGGTDAIIRKGNQAT